MMLLSFVTTPVYIDEATLNRSTASFFSAFKLKLIINWTYYINIIKGTELKRN